MKLISGSVSTDSVGFNLIMIKNSDTWKKTVEVKNAVLSILTVLVMSTTLLCQIIMFNQQAKKMKQKSQI